MESRTSRRIGRIGLAGASLVLLGNGIAMIIAAVLDIVYVHSLPAIGLGSLLAPTGIGSITAAVRLYAGSHKWWLASLTLLPITAAFQFLDAYVFGDGQVPVGSGIILPAAAVACLLLPPVRLLIRPASPTTEATSST